MWKHFAKAFDEGQVDESMDPVSVAKTHGVQQGFAPYPDPRVFFVFWSDAEAQTPHNGAWHDVDRLGGGHELGGLQQRPFSL